MLGKAKNDKAIGIEVKLDKSKIDCIRLSPPPLNLFIVSQVSVFHINHNSIYLPPQVTLQMPPVFHISITSQGRNICIPPSNNNESESTESFCVLVAALPTSPLTLVPTKISIDSIAIF